MAFQKEIIDAGPEQTAATDTGGSFTDSRSSSACIRGAYVSARARARKCISGRLSRGGDEPMMTMRVRRRAASPTLLS